MGKTWKQNDGGSSEKREECLIYIYRNPNKLESCFD